MGREKNGLNPILKRGLICGIALGIIFSIILRVNYSIIDSRYILIIFLLVVGVVGYRYIGNPVYSLISGIIAFLVVETFGNFLWGALPFLWVNYLNNSSIFLPYILPELIIGYIGYPVAGYIGGYLCQKRQLVRVFDSENIPITDLESRVIEYIKMHNYQIQISDCAVELGVDADSVKRTLKSLESKGQLQTRYSK
jgi:hypothetical protein